MIRLYNSTVTGTPCPNTMRKIGQCTIVVITPPPPPPPLSLKSVYRETDRNPLHVKLMRSDIDVSVFQSKHTLCHLTWMKEERNAGLLMLWTFCLALVSDTFGCKKVLGVIELSLRYLSKDFCICAGIPRLHNFSLSLSLSVSVSVSLFYFFIFLAWEVLWVCW